MSSDGVGWGGMGNDGGMGMGWDGVGWGRSRAQAPSSHLASLSQHPASASVLMSSQMDALTRALCYWYRHPPANSGVEPAPYETIAGEVGFSVGAVYKAVQSFNAPKQKRGRKKGWRKTTKSEDKVIMSTFHKVRPPGHGVESRGACARPRPPVRPSTRPFARPLARLPSRPPARPPVRPSPTRPSVCFSVRPSVRQKQTQRCG